MVSDWTVVKLKDIAKHSKGAQINGDDLIEDGTFDYLNGGINPSGKWNESNVNGNTITISEGGNSSGYVNFMTEPFWCGAHCYYLYDVKCNSKFLYYALKSQQDRVMALRSGACMPNIKKNDLAEFSFRYNPNPEIQAKIVAIMDKVTALISLRKKQLKKLDELVKSRFSELFGDPVKNDRQWNTISLGDACDGIGDGLHGTPEYSEHGNYPFINGNNLMNGIIEITPATKMVDESTYYKHFIDLSNNAILISINGTLGKLALYNGEQIMLGKSACYCNLKPEINRKFVYWVMKSDSFADFLESNSTKSTIKNVGLKAMREYKLIIPPKELQELFVSLAEQTDKSKSAIQKSLEQLETLKKSLMQKYFG